MTELTERTLRKDAQRNRNHGMRYGAIHPS